MKTDRADSASTEQGSSRRLPRGSHGIPAELIVRNQRDRLIAATAEVTAERGYAGTTVRDIVGRAGVSSATFYTIFKGLDDCVLATFWELHGRLMAEIDVACKDPSNSEPKPRRALRRSLELFATDAPATRLLTVEILGAGPAGARSQHEAIARTAQRIGIEGKAGWGLVALVTTMVAERVVASEEETIPQLEGELASVLAAYRDIGGR